MNDKYSHFAIFSFCAITIQKDSGKEKMAIKESSNVMADKISCNKQALFLH